MRTKERKSSEKCFAQFLTFARLIIAVNIFNFDLKKWLLGLALILLPLVSINVEKNRKGDGWIDRPFYLVAQNLQSVFFKFSSGITDTTKDYLNLIDIKKQIQATQAQNTELKARLTLFNELLAENERLKNLLNFRVQTQMELLPAQVIARDLDPDHRTLTINRGTQHGLKRGQAVITAEGVLGYVFKPQAEHSLVLLLSDRYAVVDGIVARSRARGIVEGQGTHSCRLEYIEKSEDIKVGDLIITSGLDNIFPKGLPIAKVTRIDNKPFSVSLLVELEPVVSANRTEEVLIVIDAKNTELSQNNL